jgi:hypothetical protein
VVLSPLTEVNVLQLQMLMQHVAQADVVQVRAPILPAKKGTMTCLRMRGLVTSACVVEADDVGAGAEW